MIEDLVQRVFCTRNYAHVAHFQTKSYAEHMALDEFYNNVIEAIDTLVEAYQGSFGLIKDLPKAKDEKITDIIALLSDDAKWMKANRDSVCKKITALENLLDGVMEVYLKAIYKLKNLK